VYARFRGLLLNFFIPAQLPLKLAQNQKSAQSPPQNNNLRKSSTPFPNNLAQKSRTPRES
jgi:hypothetical protein